MNAPKIDIDPAKATKWYADINRQIDEAETIRDFCSEQLDDADRKLVNLQHWRRAKLEALAQRGWTPPESGAS